MELSPHNAGIIPSIVIWFTMSTITPIIASKASDGTFTKLFSYRRH